MPSPADLHFDAIAVGAKVSFRRVVQQEDVEAFARLSGDFNPLHVDPQYAAQTQFGRPIVHGMFLGSLLSCLVGMHLPGRRCLYVSQSLDFLQPVHVGDELEITGEVQHKQDALRTIVIQTEIRILPEQLAVRGKAHVKVLE